VKIVFHVAKAKTSPLSVHMRADYDAGLLQLKKLGFSGSSRTKVYRNCSLCFRLKIALYVFLAPLQEDSPY